MADINAEDLTQETVSTLDGNEQFIMFDSVEGKRALLSLIADYIANHGEISGSTIPTLISAIEAKIGTLTNLTTTDKSNLVAAINELVGDTADLKEDLDEVQDELPNKADKDGTYPDLTAGNSQQLLSDNLTTDEVPYLFRANPTDSDREYDKIVGASAAVNQLVDKSKYVLDENARSLMTVSDGRIYGAGTLAGGANIQFIVKANNTLNVIAGHKYLLTGMKKYTGFALFLYNGTDVQTLVALAASTRPESMVFRASYSGYSSLYLNRGNAGEVDVDVTPQLIDLTAYFGSTAIADRAYTLESGTAGAGIAWLKQNGFDFSKYTPYNAGTLQSVKTSKHKMVGFNQWDEEWEVGGYDTSTGAKNTATDRIRSKNYIKVMSGDSYYIKMTSGRLFLYDGNYNFISTTPIGNAVYAIPDGIKYMTFQSSTGYGTTYNHDICINLHGSRDGEYEPYRTWEYPLDDVELKGVYEYDSVNDRIKANGDVYSAEGTQGVNYDIVNLGSLEWKKNTSGNYFYATISGVKRSADWNTVADGIICPKYIADTANNVAGAVNDKRMAVVPNADRLIIYDTAYASSDATAFTTAMDGVYLIYPLATPTTESADPYRELQIAGSTEEYIDGRTVELPVGHVTKYPDNIRAKVDMIPPIPTTAGNYKLNVTVTNGVAKGQWVAI